MRYIRYAFLAALAVILIAVAMANRQMVGLVLLPAPLAELLGLNLSTQMPLFLVIFGGIVAGLLIGFVWEWLREHRHRAEAARKEREVAQLRREIKALKSEKSSGKDDVLALLDETG